ncbi:MAG: group III truncated hemoglobin [Caulobacteraceae bacterium]
MSETASAAQARRAAFTAKVETETGIDEAMIERLVRAFYVRVRADPLIGPVFEARIADWEPHLQRMFAFWSSVALMSGRYHGQPMAKHLPLAIDAHHFDRWLELFAQTARDLCPPVAAERFVELSKRIGESLELGLAGARGQLLAKGERLPPLAREAQDADPAWTGAAAGAAPT